MYYSLLSLKMISFVLFYSPKPRSQVWILIYRNWSICWSFLYSVSSVKELAIEYCDTQSLKLETRSSHLEVWMLRVSRCKDRVSRHEDQVLSFNDQGWRIQEARFSERTMLYSHVAVQIFAPSISACGAVFCNCLNCQGSASFQ